MLGGSSERPVVASDTVVVLAFRTVSVRIRALVVALRPRMRLLLHLLGGQRVPVGEQARHVWNCRPGNVTEAKN